MFDNKLDISYNNSLSNQCNLFMVAMSELFLACPEQMEPFAEQCFQITNAVDQGFFYSFQFQSQLLSVIPNSISDQQ